MKNIFRNKKIAALCILLIAASCKKLDINESPNYPPVESATMEVLFPSAVMSTVGEANGDLSVVGGMWAQFWTQNGGSSQFRTVDSYNLISTSPFIGRPYSELYTGALNDYHLGLEKAVAAKDWRFNLMNTVMKAYTFEILVDLFDKVPYTETFQSTVILQPKFDDGYTIYKALISEIDAALAKDYRGTVHTDEQTKVDFVFGEGGKAAFDIQMDNWEKFANTLKLKMYLRMAYVKPAEAEAGIKKLYQDGAKFLEMGAGVSNFEDAPNKSNPFYEYIFRRLNTPDNLKASVTLTSWLEKNNDPRETAYYKKGPFPSANQGDYLAPVVKGIPNPVIEATETAWLISPAECYFMQAEALERYSSGMGAKDMYDKGVTAAFAQVGLTPGALLGGVYAYPEAGTFDAKLEAVIVQKWASLFGSHALEAFFEQNRTGYPRISPVYSTDDHYKSDHAGQLVYSKTGVTGPGNFPRRMLFPDEERSRNSNTPAQVPIYTRVWWSVAPAN